MSKGVRRVLIYRLGSLGDMVVALPCLHLVARAFPHADRRMLTNFPVHSKAAAAGAVLGESGLVPGYFEYPAEARDWRVLAGLWWRLLCFRPQIVVYLAAARGLRVARRDRLFFRLLGNPKLIGFPLSEAMQQNQPQGAAWEPECARLARNIRELGDARLGDRASWDLHLSPAELARGEQALAAAGGRPVLAISLGTKRQTNEWGAERWRELLRELGSRYAGYALVFTGVAEEQAASEWVAAGWREGAGAGAVVVNLCGELTPRESAACFARAKLFLGHDSGPMHLAAAVGTRVVAVFSGRNRPGIWFPYGEGHRAIYHRVDCMGCRLAECVVEGKKCIYGIGVGEVLAAVDEVLVSGRVW